MSFIADYLMGNVSPPPVSIYANVRTHQLSDKSGHCNATAKGLERNARIRAENVEKVTRAIGRGRGKYTELSISTGLSEATVKSIVVELIDKGQAKRTKRNHVVLSEACQ